MSAGGSPATAARKASRLPGWRGRNEDSKKWTAGDGPLIAASGLHKSFDSNHVLRGIDLTIHAGDVVSLIGPSGCGKSTLLRCLNLLEQPSAGDLVVLGRPIVNDGEMLVRGRELVSLRRGVGMVFQQFNLFQHLTAIENIILPLVQGTRVDQEEAIGIAYSALGQVGLPEKAMAYPETLSGGQQQRVAIARALALRPLVLLFDEPTSSLDPESTGEVLSVMRELAESGMAMVVATHEIQFARVVSDRTVFVDEGLIAEEGSSEVILSNPTAQRTKAFLRQLTHLPERDRS